MSWVVWLLVVPVSALVTGGGLRAAHVPRRTAGWAGIAAGVFTGVALVALWFTAFGECVGDGSATARDSSWHWSPRAQFCSNDSSSPVALGWWALLLVPTVMVMLGTFLRFKQRSALGWMAYAVVLATPVLPSVYLNALPYYRMDSYPVLHQPLLRRASGSQPARVCYVYGIAFGSRKVKVTAATIRDCVNLKPMPQARRLKPSYDGGRTSDVLDHMGQKLTQKGLPARPGATGVKGLVVDRVYKLRDSQARIGATLVN